MTHTVEVRGLRVEAVIGALDEERRAPQPLRVDLDLDLSVEDAGRSDRLDDTVDYAGLVEATVAVLTGSEPVLLEFACDLVANALLAADERVDAVTVTIAKLRPPVPQAVDSVGVRRRVVR